MEYDEFEYEKLLFEMDDAIAASQRDRSNPSRMRLTAAHAAVWEYEELFRAETTTYWEGHNEYLFEN